MSHGKLKMSTISVLKIKDPQNNKIFNFFNGRFSLMGGPMNIIFGEPSKKYNFPFFLNI